MLKWIIIGAIALLVTILAIRIIKVMLHTEKQAKQEESKNTEPPVEYTPEQSPIDLHSSSSGVSLSDLPDAATSNVQGEEYQPLDTVYEDTSTDMGFMDNIDDEFADYRRHAQNRGRRRKPVDIDLDGDMADEDFEYVPDSPEFNYLQPRRREPKKDKPTIKQSLNDMPTELKVLMLSDIFDRKFF